SGSSARPIGSAKSPELWRSTERRRCAVSVRMRLLPASRPRALRVRRAVVLSALPLLLGACSWFSDFKEQPKIEPWEAEYAGNDTTPFRGNPMYSVPITGERVPSYVVSH